MKGVSLKKLLQLRVPTCTGGSVRRSCSSFLSETPFMKRVYFSKMQDQTLNVGVQIYG